MYNHYSKECVLKRIRQAHYHIWACIASLVSDDFIEKSKLVPFEKFASFYDSDWLGKILTEWETSKGLDSSEHIQMAMEDIFGQRPGRVFEKDSYIYGGAIFQPAISSSSCIFSETKLIFDAKRMADYFLFNNYVEAYYEFVKRNGQYDAIALITKMSTHEEEALNKYFELRASYKKHLNRFAMFVFEQYKIDTKIDTSAESIYTIILEHTGNIKESAFEFVKLYENFMKNEQIQPTSWL